MIRRLINFTVWGSVFFLFLFAYQGASGNSIDVGRQDDEGDPQFSGSRSPYLSIAAVDTPTSTATNTPDPNPTSTSTSTATPTPQNLPPSISQVNDQIIKEDEFTPNIPFQIADLDTPEVLLEVSATSTNKILVPDSNIFLSGSGANRSIKIQPAANEHGTTQIIITVSDGLDKAEESFQLEVTAVNDPPLLDLNGSGSGTNFATNFVYKGPAINITSGNLSIADVDDENIDSAKVTLTNRPNGIREILAANTSGTNISSVYIDGVLNLSGLASVADYEKVMRTITYKNSANSLNDADRIITIYVYDGDDNSNKTQSVISIINPRLSLSKNPETQTIPSGGSAIFTIQVKNIGNMTLDQVRISDPNSTNCNRNIGTLLPNTTRTYSCSKQNITASFTNNAAVSGEDIYGNRTSASDSAVVEVDNPNIQIVLSPPKQILKKGETANFEVFVFNTSSTVDLINVEVTDPLTPDCNRLGNHAFSNLPSGQNIQYSCQVANIREAFTNEIFIKGKNLLTQEIVEDQSLAEVELIDIEVILEAEPDEVAASGNLVNFTATINNTGSLPITLQKIKSDELGMLSDPTNNQLQNNGCAVEPLPHLFPGEQFICPFTTIIKGTPPTFRVGVLAEGIDSEGNTVDDHDTVSITIIDKPTLDVAMIASPPSIPAPAGRVVEDVSIANTSTITTIVLEELNHSSQGNLHGVGDCSLPQVLSTQGSYQCSYEVTVRGRINDQEIHAVTAVGSDNQDNNYEGVGKTTINIISPSIRTAVMPIINNAYQQPEEDNDLPCTAFPIMTNQTYSFFADDVNDWYFFDIVKAGTINISLNNYPVSDGQLAVWTGESCHSLTIRVGHNANFSPNKSIEFDAPPGRYYVWLTNFDNKGYENPYALKVSVP